MEEKQACDIVRGMSRAEWVLMLLLWAFCLAFCLYRIEALNDARGVEDAETINISAEEETPLAEAPSGSQGVIKYDSVGQCLLTHYCTCEACCGKSNGITASGTVATPHRTVAVDPKLIPIGSVLLIDGFYYIAEDTGGAIKGNRIDICVGSHEEALNAGVKSAEVFIVSVEEVGL